MSGWIMVSRQRDGILKGHRRRAASGIIHAVFFSNKSTDSVGLPTRGGNLFARIIILTNGTTIDHRTVPKMIVSLDFGPANIKQILAPQLQVISLHPPPVKNCLIFNDGKI